MSDLARTPAAPAAAQFQPLSKITKVSDDFVVIEVSDTVELKIQKPAIAATLPKGTLKAI